MYFPYLRGRQYELLALRDMLNNGLLSKKVIPIIEPVKASSTTLTVINTFVEKKHEFILIRNPKVGSFVHDGKKEENAQLLSKIKGLTNEQSVFSGIIIDDELEILLKELIEQGIPFNRIVALCLANDRIESFQSTFKDKFPQYCVIPYAPAFRRIRNCSRVMISDKFNKLSRNTDYLQEDDEFFSDDHLYFSEDGYKGFSDYSIVGLEYMDSGFAPFAVAIHIVYFDANKELRIHHFVSDSNDDRSDPANKFYEALTKLHKWNETMKLDSFAIRTFNEMYKKESYPGLGVVKKLSIMHHLEIMGKYLDEVGV